MKQKTYLNVITIILLLYILINVSPLFLILINSFKPVREITTNPYGLPLNPTLFNYDLLLGWSYKTVGISFDAPPLLPSLLITIKVSSLCVVLSLILGLMAAYGLSRYRIGGNFLPFWFLSLLFAPPIVFAFPLYLMYRKLGLLDSTIGLVGANLTFNLPFAIWIFYSYLSGTSEEIEEAALIDGANSWIIFWKIITPIMRPIVIAVGALTFIFVWNEYLFSTILMNLSKTLTIALGGYNTGQLILYTSIAAGIIIDIIPPILILIFFEKYLVTGLSFGAVKG